MIRNWQKQGMKNMVILVDTNIILDFLTMRQPYYDEARNIIRMCAEEQVEGYLAFHSLPNIFYILRKAIRSLTDGRCLRGYVLY